jgi:hypothetical protein
VAPVIVSSILLVASSVVPSSVIIIPATIIIIIRRCAVIITAAPVILVPWGLPPGRRGPGPTVIYLRTPRRGPRAFTAIRALFSVTFIPVAFISGRSFIATIVVWTGPLKYC